MRWIRLFLLGLASVYPLYWTAQFVLFFLPESLLGFWLGQPVQVVSINYLQAVAFVLPRAAFPAHWEALTFALFFSLAILGVRADRYLTGALAVVILGQSALLPFVGLLFSVHEFSADSLIGGLLAFALMLFGLYVALRHVGGVEFLDRLALLNLLVVLPEVGLWLGFKFAYPFFDVRFLLLLLLPLYAAAVIAAILPPRWYEEVLVVNVPWSEILATSAAAGLLILAIGLSSRSIRVLDSRAPAGFPQPPVHSRASMADAASPQRLAG